MNLDQYRVRGHSKSMFLIHALNSYDEHKDMIEDQRSSKCWPCGLICKRILLKMYFYGKLLKIHLNIHQSGNILVLSTATKQLPTALLLMLLLFVPALLLTPEMVEM